MLQYVSITERPAKNRRGLVDDGRIGDYVNYAAKAVLQRVLQCVREGRECLAAAGRYGQREETPRLFRGG